MTEAVVMLPLSELTGSHTPRAEGVNMQHALVLAQLDVELPPIVVHRQTMRVIDGMHRIAAARIRGHETISARYFEGELAEAFLLAVQLNVAHGLPLSLSDRRAAAERIVKDQWAMSDRSIARTVGLAAKTVAAIRQRCGAEQGPTRIGQDGRVRPVNHEVGRRLALEYLTEHPDASLRTIARHAGIAVETARDVRMRARQAAERVEGQDQPSDAGAPAEDEPDRVIQPLRRRSVVTIPTYVDSIDIEEILQNLMNDPVLRYSNQGRLMLRWLGAQALLPHRVPPILTLLPAHCRSSVSRIAWACAASWINVARELEGQSET
jgi:ParB-like chromosome segregation protein Spo0J